MSYESNASSEQKPVVERNHEGLLRYADKMKQAHREACAAVIALVATILVWIALGFGLSGTNLEVFHTPLWIVGGTLGTWIFSIIVVVVMARYIFVDFSFDDCTDQSCGGCDE